ncbi:cytochrome P450 [Nocardia nova]|uniref:cytochrome P450 n=1 Tax=Nocardia nova TaxID=37330 RepID=UPI00371C30FA
MPLELALLGLGFPHVVEHLEGCAHLVGELQHHLPRHLTFSHGPHFCVGAPVARLQGEVLFTQLMRRMPDFRLLDDTPPYRESISMRGPRTLRARARSMR